MEQCAVLASDDFAPVRAARIDHHDLVHNPAQRFQQSRQIAFLVQGYDTRRDAVHGGLLAGSRKYLTVLLTETSTPLRVPPFGPCATMNSSQTYTGECVCRSTFHARN